ncbi:hypothetical protein G6045_10405 [Streptomyces sp. YC504]|uniref:Uncharacterized protein n=1 Tax=Streptomyces mesophilus TaxID=1775132 RepID=A0A6G4XHG5_9ACTN|nr:DUF5994 family protein [Streptomyces mesophilus]NGO76081.1 hypothetical protein [Streptomyces mesophilus]
MSLAPYSLPPSQPLLRLHLAPAAGGPRAIDGVWWPRSPDLLTELPVLLAGLPPTWGHITSVRLNGALWAAAPGRLLVAGQVVRLRRSLAATGTDTVVLLSPGRGRWDLLVVPPDEAGTDQPATSPEFLANFLEQAGH